MPLFNRVPRMFRLPSHRVFDYKPRFYDEEKEKFDQLRKRKAIHQEKELSSDTEDIANYKSNIRAGFSRTREVRSGYNGNSKYSIRVVSIIAILAAIFYLIFFI
jgi:hypothetical protein